MFGTGLARLVIKSIVRKLWGIQVFTTSRLQTHSFATTCLVKKTQGYRNFKNNKKTARYPQLEENKASTCVAQFLRCYLKQRNKSKMSDIT